MLVGRFASKELSISRLSLSGGLAFFQGIGCLNTAVVVEKSWWCAFPQAAGRAPTALT